MRTWGEWRPVYVGRGERHDIYVVAVRRPWWTRWLFAAVERVRLLIKGEL
jgi:hypothetical protein